MRWPSVAVVALASRELAGDAVLVPAAAFRVPPREVEEMLPQQALLLLAARDAAAQADLGPDAAAFVGVSLDLNATNFHLRWAFPDRADALGPPLTANRTMGALASIAASRLAREFRIGGPCFTVSAGDAGGLRAVELGVRALERGEVDAALVGAVDLRHDPREPAPGRSLAVALILRRLDDARRDGQRVLATVGDIEVHTDDADGEATAGLVPLTGAAGGTRIELVPADPPAAEERLFVVEGDVAGGLARLRFDEPSRHRTGADGRAVVILARTPEELKGHAEAAARHLRDRPDEPARERFFYSPHPLKGRVAFTYPGSGNDFPRMGRAMLRRWPEVARRQRRDSRRQDEHFPPRPATVEQRIAAQVALGNVVTDVLASFGVTPAAALGYSLGESAALFGLRAWADRDGLFDAMERSPLFKTDLCGPCDAARRAWGVDHVDWVTAVFERPADEVRGALPDRAYLQFIHGPAECVVGGDRAAVQELARRLGASPVLVPTTTTMHCPVVNAVADEYRRLHVWPVRDAGVTFYSSAWGRAYDVTAEGAADAILAQATGTVDFARAVEAAYADGVRVFVEAGPGASVSRVVSMALAGRPHVARSACVAGPDGLGPLWRVLAALIAERVPVDLAAAHPEEGPMIRVPVGPPFA
ncbi:MAG: beta-ketoacyl synthase N-terminal-like domain-containing protein, partial [Gemmataceae bacterium]